MEQNLSLSAVVLDPALQVRERLDTSWIEELTELYRGLHTIDPVAVVFDGKRHLLVDGWHRIEAQRRIEPNMMIAVEVIDASGTSDPMAVAKMRAAMANRGAGLRRTDGDKRRAVLLLRSTSEGRKMTHDEIAKRVGVDRSYVSKILAAAENVTGHNGNDDVLVTGRAPLRAHIAALWVQVDAALRSDPGKPDAQHAREVGCHADVVRHRRETLGLSKSDPKRWKDTTRPAVIAELRRNPDRPNAEIATATGASPATVAKIRTEENLPARPSGGSRPRIAAAGPETPSAPMNARRGDPREQGQEVLAVRPLRPPPAPRSDFVTEVMQRVERADRIDRQALVTAIWKRWPELLRNALEEGREDGVVLQ